MTCAEWDATPPRDRDALVAEKVMGCDVDGQPQFGKCTCGCLDRAHTDDLYRDLRPYTTSWDAMREVVEKMHDDGWTWSIGQAVNPKIPDKHLVVASFDRYGEPDNCYDGIAPDVPEAVCIAALTALGVIR